jgi:endonuclease YncB( thermonuclease family)
MSRAASNIASEVRIIGPRQWLAGHGWAAPYRDCKCEVVRDAADMARLEHVGIWSGTFVMPWEWRKHQ